MPKFVDFDSEVSPADSDHVVGYRVASPGGARRFTLARLRDYLATALASTFASAAQGATADTALQDASAFASAAQGAKADAALTTETDPVFVASEAHLLVSGDKAKINASITSEALFLASEAHLLVAGDKAKIDTFGAVAEPLFTASEAALLVAGDKAKIDGIGTGVAFVDTDLRTILPTSNPGGGKPWNNGGLVAIGTLP